MQSRSSLLVLLFCLLFAGSIGRSLSNLKTVNAQETCNADAGWLANSNPPSMTQPPAHPASDCPFYQAAWRQFLFAMEADQNAQPRFLTSYKTVSDLFPTSDVAASSVRSSVALLAMRATPAAKALPQTKGAQSRSLQSHPLLMLAPRSIQQSNDRTVNGHTDTNVNAGVSQAGPAQGVLIDQRGNPIYYAIHVNPAFAQFLQGNGLTSADALRNAAAVVHFDQAGIVELKTAWQIVDSAHPPQGYFTMRANVPNLKVTSGKLLADGTVREVTVALIAIHVAFTMEGHPEMVWSTFDHLSSDGRGVQDNAPSIEGRLPSEVAPGTVVSHQQWNLYKAETSIENAIKPLNPSDLVLAFDEGSQTFTKNGTTVQTSVYRYYPTSKTTRDPDNSLEVDGAITALNTSMQSIFQTASSDVRRNYQLVGAIWMDNPARDFKENLFITNQPGQSTDTPGAMVAGEDGLSSVAMESFTQDTQGNCFSCHNTRAVRSDVTNKIILGPKQLNVSHVLSKYLSTLQPPPGIAP